MVKQDCHCIVLSNTITITAHCQLQLPLNITTVHGLFAAALRYNTGCPLFISFVRVCIGRAGGNVGGDGVFQSIVTCNRVFMTLITSNITSHEAAHCIMLNVAATIQYADLHSADLHSTQWNPCKTPRPNPWFLDIRSHVPQTTNLPPLLSFLLSKCVVHEKKVLRRAWSRNGLY